MNGLDGEWRYITDDGHFAKLSGLRLDLSIKSKRYQCMSTLPGWEPSLSECHPPVLLGTAVDWSMLANASSRKC